jgi:flagellar hook-basal body complex protein FliE
MINLDANVSSVLSNINKLPSQTGKPLIQSGATEKTNFAKTIETVGQCISKVDDLNHSADLSIKDLLAGENTDITSVVSAVAKADMSFKLLIGVRNKLIEAYKQTMNMPI